MNSLQKTIAILNRVLTEKCSLTSAFDEHNELSPEIKAWCFGVIRYYFSLSELIKELVKKPLKQKDNDVLCLIYASLFRLRSNSAPEYAIVSEAVETTKKIDKKWASGFVNAVLRNYLREQKKLDEKIKKSEYAIYEHPKWLIEKIKNDWPEKWKAILEENNVQPPMWLRINLQKTTVNKYKKLFDQKTEENDEIKSALLLSEPCDVKSLPGFEDGLFSVQDIAAQKAVEMLDLKPKLRVLDACAAPGGKTCHILESEPNVEQLIVLEIDSTRTNRITENAKRLGLLSEKIKVLTADATKTNEWYDNKTFDRILIDAPCSGSGVIRRHPDIKLLKQASDIPNLVKLQHELLCALWPLLKPGGILVYATCSILIDENTKQIQSFLKNEQNAKQIHEEQFFPTKNGTDGFYFAKLEKKT